jgi:hypothetical protein
LSGIILFLVGVPGMLGSKTTPALTPAHRDYPLTELRVTTSHDQFEESVQRRRRHLNLVAKVASANVVLNTLRSDPDIIWQVR